MGNPGARFGIGFEISFGECPPGYPNARFRI
jgi:hypothetical protein